jgi:uncharacterized protein (TIGR03435 family)
MDFVFPEVAPGKLIPAFREFYRIEAIAPAGTKLDEARAMLLKVLMNRLGLQYHMEERRTPVYYLVRGSGPLRLSPPKAGRGSKVQSTFQLKSNAEPVQRLASFLQSLTRREVIDKTGIDGLYSFDIDLLSEIQAQPDIGTSLAFAEAKRLGLKLEPGTEIRKYFMVDKVTKYPTAN